VQDFVSSAAEGFEPKRPMLKLDAIPTEFCFSNPTKHRKLSEAKEARAMHCSIIDDLLTDPKNLHLVKNLHQLWNTMWLA